MSSIQELFSEQKKFRWEVAKSTYKQRRQWLEQLRTKILDHEEDLKTALWQDFAKHPLEVELSEITPVILEINHILANLKQWMAPQSVGTPFFLWPARSFLRAEAKGQVLILSPWNYPFSLCLSPLAMAISAGNTVVLKPSEKTPNTSLLIQKIVSDIFPPRHASVVLGDFSVAAELTSLGFDHIFFTGSTQVGKKVMSAASQHLTSVTLELGGKSPVLMDEDASVKQTMETLVWGKFLNAGQTCIAPDYLLAPRSLRESIFQNLKTIVDSLNLEEMAKIIDEAAYRRLDALFNESEKFGDEIIVGGVRSLLERKISVTAIECHPDQPWNSPWLREEIFGPILPIIFYTNIDEVLNHLRERPKPLAFYFFGQKNEDKIKEGTTAGSFVSNNIAIQFGNHHLPFGGVGPSGMGASHGKFGFQQFSHLKPIMQQGPVSFGSLLFPPYQRTAAIWGRKFLQFLRRD
jgi:aldehyde dehydrogenase (NAD+)